MWQGCCQQSSCLVRNVVTFNLDQDGIKRSSKESAFYPNVPDCPYQGWAAVPGPQRACHLHGTVFWRFPPGAAYPWPTPAWAMMNLPIPRLAMWLTPILQLALPTKSDVALRPALFSPTLRRIPPLFGNGACRQESSPPTLQGNLPTLNDFVPRPTPTPPMPQHVQPTLGNVVTWRHWPTLSLAQPPHGNVAPWSMPFPPTLQPMMLKTPPTLTTLFLRPNLFPSSMAPRTKSDVVLQWILTPPMPQRIRPTLGVVACWPCRPTLSPVRPPCGNIAWWPHLPKPLLALWLPVNAASP
jgi:hypothetical protein